MIRFGARPRRPSTLQGPGVLAARGFRLTAELMRRRKAGSRNTNPEDPTEGLSEPLVDLFNSLDLTPQDRIDELAHHATYLLWNSLEEAGESKLANAYEKSEYDTAAMLRKVRRTKRLGQAWLERQMSGWETDVMTDIPAMAPSFLFFDRPTVRRHTWLVHFTDHADSIVAKGFTKGISDPRTVGLTTHFTDRAKAQPGYAFAYLPEDVNRYVFRSLGDGNWSTKYGKEAVLFCADAVVAYHHNDEERQAITWGPEAKRRHALTVERRRFVLGGVEYDSISEMIAAVEKEPR